MDEQNTTLSTAEAAREELTLPPMPEPPAPPATVNVVDIHFRSGGKVYFFDPGDLTLQSGQHVIISTARGLEYGICASGVHAVPKRDIVPPLRPVLRIATTADEKMMQESRDKEKRAFAVCQKKIAEHGLEMQLVSAECAFDGSKILFFFTADGRVDFRELVKTLASTFRTRIELRQIGVRDKAKMVGGLGICGRPFCCSEFLADFQPVSIKMAKVQNLSLNPTKISGTCGRLMCCLKYEQDAYEDLIKHSPKQESFVDTPDGRGTVKEVNLLRQSVKVSMEKQPDTIGCYKNDEICILRNGKARKNDPPIPDDLAPISGSGVKRRKLDEEEPFPVLEDVVIKTALPDEPTEKPSEPKKRRSRSRGKRSGQSKDGAAPKPQAKEPRASGGKQSAPRQDSQPQRKPAPAAEGDAPANKPHRRRRHRKPRPSGDAPKASE